MATVLDLIKSARLLLNIDAVGDSVSANEAQDSLQNLNWMLDSWNTQRLMLWNMLDVTGTLQANKNPHSIGLDKAAYSLSDSNTASGNHTTGSIVAPLIDDIGNGSIITVQPTITNAGGNYWRVYGKGPTGDIHVIAGTPFNTTPPTPITYVVPADISQIYLTPVYGGGTTGDSVALSVTSAQVYVPLYAQTTDIPVDRFLRIERAFTRTPGVSSPVDFPMEIISSARYQEFTVKKIGTNYPTHLYYEPSFPIAYLYTFPVQTTALEIHMSVWNKLTQFASVNDTVSVPEGYLNAIRYNLAVEIAPQYGKVLVKGTPIFDRAAQLLRQLKAINQEEKHAVLDLALVNNQSHGFQLYRGY
jgi:hypothetical protein